MSIREKRLQRIEKVLNMDESQGSGVLIVLSDEDCPEQEALPQNIDDWIIYQQQKTRSLIASQGSDVTILLAADEVEAQRLQKVT